MGKEFTNLSQEDLCDLMCGKPEEDIDEGGGETPPFRAKKTKEKKCCNNCANYKRANSRRGQRHCSKDIKTGALPYADTGCRGFISKSSIIV